MYENYQLYFKWIMREMTKIVMISFLVSFAISFVFKNSYIPQFWGIIIVITSFGADYYCNWEMFHSRSVTDNQSWNICLYIISGWIVIECAFVIPARVMLVCFLFFELIIIVGCLGSYVISRYNLYAMFYKIGFVMILISILSLIYILLSRMSVYSTLGVGSLMLCIFGYYVTSVKELELEEINTNYYKEYCYGSIVIRYIVFAEFWLLGVILFRVLFRL